MIRIKGEEIALSRFPDGTLHLTPNLPDISLEEPSEAYALITWNYESDEKMAAILFLTKHLKKHCQGADRRGSALSIARR